MAGGRDSWMMGQQGAGSLESWAAGEEEARVRVQVCLTVFVLDFLLEMWKVIVSSPMKM